MCLQNSISMLYLGIQKSCQVILLFVNCDLELHYMTLKTDCEIDDVGMCEHTKNQLPKLKRSEDIVKTIILDIFSTVT